MSLSISKLLDLASASQDSNDKLNKSIRAKDVPERTPNITPSQYYNSVKRMPKNGQNILMRGTPDGSRAMPTGDLQDPKGFAEDGSIDPENIRKKKDPLHALPDNFYAGNDGFLYGLPPSTMKETNSVSLLQKARGSYYSRLTMYQPKQFQKNISENPIVPVVSDSGSPPDYEAAMGTNTKNESFVNDSVFS